MRIIAIAVLILLFASCSDNNKKTLDNNENLAFFYPFNNEPKIYVYQDSLNPMFEVFERVFTTDDTLLGKHLWIERYNANFRLTETIELVYEKNLNVYNHLVGVRGDLYNAEVRDSSFFPFFGTSHFSSTFPSNIDTIAFHYDSRRSLSDEKSVFQWNDKELKTIVVLDTIKTYAIDTKNKKEKMSSSIAKSIYAEGIGKVQVKSVNGKVNLKLTRILTEAEWKHIITKD